MKLFMFSLLLLKFSLSIAQGDLTVVNNTPHDLLFMNHSQCTDHTLCSIQKLWIGAGFPDQFTLHPQESISRHINVDRFMKGNMMQLMFSNSSMPSIQGTVIYTAQQGFEGLWFKNLSLICSTGCLSTAYRWCVRDDEDFTLVITSSQSSS